MCGGIFLFFCFFAFLLCFCNYTNAYLWGQSWHGDTEDHQPATSVDLSKAAGWEMDSARSRTGSLKLAYTCSLLPGWKMNCQLLSTCSDTTLLMAEACSACYLLSPQLGTSSGKGVCWQGGEEEKGSLSEPIPCPLLLQAVGSRSVPLTFVSPAELLSKMKWSRLVPACERRLAVSCSASCMPRCCCFLQWPCWFT